MLARLVGMLDFCRMRRNILPILTFILALSAATGCGVQSIPQSVNEVDAAWAEVQNQYQRRIELIPNLVNTVKGEANFEKDTLKQVMEARASATQIKLDAKDLNEANLAKFQAAQDQLRGALSRLMVVAENYPQLKANQAFRDLQVQLEGTENRIAIARNRYIEQVKIFNNLVSVFPTNVTNSLLFHHDKKPQFAATSGAEKAPEVKF